MVIYFIRHGDHINNELTEIGQQQIKLSSYYLKDKNIKAMYSSITPRCLQSADILSNALNLDINKCKDLVERQICEENDCEDYKIWYDNYLNLEYSHKNPEGGKEFFERIRNCVKEIISQHSVQDNILIVGHSSIIYAIATLFFKTENVATWMSMGNGSVMAFEYFGKLY